MRTHSLSFLPLVFLLLVLAFTDCHAQNTVPDPLARQIEDILQRLAALEHQLKQARQFQTPSAPCYGHAPPCPPAPSDHDPTISPEDTIKEKHSPEIAATDEPQDLPDWLSKIFRFQPGIRATATPVNQTTTRHNYVSGGDFPHSIKVPGTETSLVIYGFI